MAINIVEAILDTTSFVFGATTRDIGGIEPDISIEEVGRDSTFVTNHPVETGAAISDHAFQMPVEVEMRVGWSDSSGGYAGYSQDIYQALQDLQTAREPFEVVTGKRVYSNMLISQLEVTTNVQSEYALMARVILREVIIVDTQNTSSVGSASNMANPASNAAPINVGTVQPIAITGDPRGFDAGAAAAGTPGVTGSTLGGAPTL